MVCSSIRSKAMTDTDVCTTSTDITIANRLPTLATSRFLCWFPTQIIGVTVSDGSRHGSLVWPLVPDRDPCLCLKPLLCTLHTLHEGGARAVHGADRLTAILMSIPLSRLHSAESRSRARGQ